MKKLLFALYLVVFSLSSFAEGGEGCIRSTEGTEFWFGFMEGRNSNDYYEGEHFLTITVTSAYDTKFSVYIEGGNTLWGTYPISSNSSYVIDDIPFNLIEVSGSEKNAESKGIYLQSDSPVNVYTMNHDHKSADAAVIYPLESIGKEYYVMCYEPHYSSWGMGLNGKNSEFLIVGTVDNTSVTITPSKVTEGGKAANVPYTITLNKGETYQVQSANGDGLAGQGDLTGSHISATEDIAVYSGNWATTVPRIDINLSDPEKIAGYDHLFEQMPPLYSLGKEYYTIPFLGRKADVFRVLAIENGTEISVGQTQQFNLDKGEMKEFLLQSDQPSRIISDKPIMVAQFSQSQTVDASYNGTNADPFMIILSSISQSKNNVTFAAYELENINKQFINIVALTDQFPNLRLDNNAISGIEFDDGNYSYAQLNLNQGTHTLLNTDVNSGFLAYVYGFGDQESYGYPVGFNLNIVLEIGNSINFDGDTLLLCPGDTLNLDAGPYFDKWDWYPNGETTQSIQVAEEGWYKVTATVLGCGELQDSVFVFKSSLQMEIVADQNGICAPDKVTLEGNSESAISFLWQTMEADTLPSQTNVLEVDSTAQYTLQVKDKYGCSAKDTIDVIIFGNPPVMIYADTPKCGDSISVVYVDFENYPESFRDYLEGFEWDSTDDNLRIISTSDSAAVFKALIPDTYSVMYQLRTKEECVSGDTLELQFLPLFSLDFEASDTTACGQLNTQLTASSDDSSLSYEWFAAGNSGFGQTVDFTISDAGLHDVRLIASSTSTGCVDTLTKYNYLEVVPFPVAAFEVDRQQVPLQDATVTFYNNSNYADSFSWIFGDGERSDLFETDHTYTDLGTYRATLIASMEAGCADSTSMLIQVVMDQIYAPNAFRPDSDIPENRVFMPIGLGLNGTNFILKIYDRWGQVIFETTSTANPWEGFYKSGQEAPMGNYIWMATYSDVDGQEHRQAGQILLIR